MLKAWCSTNWATTPFLIQLWGREDSNLRQAWEYVLKLSSIPRLTSSALWGYTETLIRPYTWRLYSVEMVGFEPTQPEALVLQTSITLPRYRISIEAIVPFSWRSTNCWMQWPAIYIGAFSNITVRPDSYREKDCLRALTLPAAGRLSPPDVSGLRRHSFCLSFSFLTPWPLCTADIFPW